MRTKLGLLPIRNAFNRVLVAPSSSSLPSTTTTISARNHFQKNKNDLNKNNRIFMIPIRCMAGHNKWSKIKHKKGAKDLNRAKLFSKATKAIRVASRACGGDLANLQLQSTIQAAKALQVPKDRIEDAISNAKKVNEADMLMQRYDGQIVTPSGKVAVIVIALTDNKNRTAANLRSNMRKSNGDMMNTGAHDFFFDHLGIVLVKKKKIEPGEEDSCDNSEQYDQNGKPPAFQGITEEEEDALLESALDGGAIDVDFGSETDEHALLKCEPTGLYPLVNYMKSNGYSLSEFQATYMVKDDGVGGSVTIPLDQESTEQFEKFLHKMDDDEDINDVYHNASLYYET